MPEIDFLRFGAAMLVLLHHLLWSAFDPNSFSARAFGTPSFAAFEPAKVGAVGVQIFFVISGAVIAHSASKGNPAAFARGRALRLLPVLWLSLVLTAVVVLAFEIKPVAIVARSFANNWFLLPYGRRLDPVIWTLRVEVLFYALVLCWIAWLPRISLLRLAAGLVAVGVIYNLALLFSVAMHGAELLGPDFERLLFVRHAPYFGLGIALASVRRGHASIGAATVILVGTVAGLAEISAQYWSGGAPLAVIIWLASLGVIAAATLRTKALGDSATRASKMIGGATYPIYLLHHPIGAVVLRGLRAVGITGLGAALAAVIVIIAAGVIVALLIEPKLRGLLASQWDGVPLRFRLIKQAWIVRRADPQPHR